MCFMKTVPKGNLDRFSTIIKNRIMINRISMFTSSLPFNHGRKTDIKVVLTEKGNTRRLSFAFVFIVYKVDYNG